MTSSIKHWLVAGCATGLALLAPFLPNLHNASVDADGEARVTASADLHQQYIRSPMAFERNEGQTDDEVAFLARGLGYSLFLTPTEAVFALRPAGAAKTAADDRMSEPAVVRMSMHGGNRNPVVEGRDEQVGKSHYFHGSDPAQWQRGVARYAKVFYRDVYPGVDVVYYGNQQQLEYDFIVAPGEDPQQIALDFAGIDALRLDRNGNLILQTGGGEITQHKPIVYQDIGGRRVPVEGRYRLLADNRVGFSLGRYDARETLVIDPVLAYQSYLGGSGSEAAASMAVDEAGNLYVAGSTESIDFPAKGGVQPEDSGGRDAFIAKFDAHNDRLIYSTYLGGSGTEYALGMVVDAGGHVYVTGQTESYDFPISPDAVQPAHATDNFLTDAFVVKLMPAGDGLRGTYLGGGDRDSGNAIALDDLGAVYVGGTTSSVDFPVQAAMQGGLSAFEDGFISKLDNDFAELIYSTYLGGSDVDEIVGIDVSSTGVAYVVGSTVSQDFPVTSALQASHRDGWYDAFVSAVRPNGSALVYSTYLGGSGLDMAMDIAVDGSGNAYVAGRTSSSDFPLAHPAQAVWGGGYDGFVGGLDATGRSLVFSTYLGGSGNDQIRGLALDEHDSVYVTGVTRSADFPTLHADQATTGGGADAFVTYYFMDGFLVWSTYLGGAGDDFGYAIATYGMGNIYVGGTTSSTNLSTPVAPFQATSGGNGDAFIARLGVRGISTYTHDFDADAVADVFWRNTSTGANVIWNSANAAAQQPVSGVNNLAWEVVGVGDFDNEGALDILWRNSSTGANTIWRSANFETPQAVTRVTNPAWKVVGVGNFGHFNGEFGSDILWRNTSTGANAIWPSANSTESRTLNTVSSQDWQVAGVGDFDGDFEDDILWRNGRTGVNAIWKSGSFSKQQPIVGVSNLDWQVVGVGDFLGDGKSDILWRNSRTGANTIWRSGNYATQQAVTGVTNPAWRVAAVGDYNGDGRSDILWRHSGGASVIWRSGDFSHQQAMTGVTNPAWTIVR